MRAAGEVFGALAGVLAGVGLAADILAPSLFWCVFGAGVLMAIVSDMSKSRTTSLPENGERDCAIGSDSRSAAG